MPLVGLATDRYGPRRVIAFGVGGLALAYLGLSYIETVWQFSALAVAQGLFQSFGGLLSTQTLA
jgi:sugar phosphate permease